MNWRTTRRFRKTLGLRGTKQFHEVLCNLFSLLRAKTTKGEMVFPSESGDGIRN